MIRRKVTDLLREVEGRPAQKAHSSVPALLEDGDLKDFTPVVRKVLKPGTIRKVLARTEPKAPVEELDEFENGTLLNMRQLGRWFGVTLMTIYHWRSRLGLPVITLPGGRNPPVRFDEGVVTEWAKRRGKSPVNTDYLEWS